METCQSIHQAWYFAFRVRSEPHFISAAPPPPLLCVIKDAALLLAVVYEREMAFDELSS